MVAARLREVADRIVELRLAPTGGQRLPRWAPGAQVDVVLPTGVTRPYSLAGDPDDAHSWRLLVASSHRDGAARYLHEQLRPGAVLTVRGPRNLFPLGGGARFVFLASGAGIAPLLPMARRVAAARVYPWSLTHLDQSSRKLALRAEVESLGPTSRSVRDPAAPLATLAESPPGTAVYACGGSHFVDTVADAAPPGTQVHRQRFDAPARDVGAGHAFELRLARRGDRIRVEPGTSVLTALHQAGVDVPMSCGAGLCGACLVPVVEGAVEHRDSILPAVERAASGQIVTCVSTAAGDHLVLDL
jgi:ferredoxin-NADP reductase